MDMQRLYQRHWFVMEIFSSIYQELRQIQFTRIIIYAL